jgi:hypothetical protein
MEGRTPVPTAQLSLTDNNVYDVATAAGGVKQLPRVTRVLSVIGKPMLLNWIAKVNTEAVTEASADLYATVAGTPPMTREAWIGSLRRALGDETADKRQLAKAGDIGTAVHKMVEWTLEKEMGVKGIGPQPTLDQDGADAFSSWLNWKSQVDLKPIKLEMTCYSLRHGYAGKLDCYGTVNGKLSVIDWKTGKAVYPESYLQNAAYRWALEEMGFETPDMGYIVRLPKQRGDSFEVVEIPKAESILYFNLFLKVLDLYQFVEQGPVAWVSGDRP